MESKIQKKRKILPLLAILLLSGVPLFADASHILSKYKDGDLNRKHSTCKIDCVCNDRNYSEYRWREREPEVRGVTYYREPRPTYPTYDPQESHRDYYGDRPKGPPAWDTYNNYYSNEPKYSRRSSGGLSPYPGPARPHGPPAW